jgi:cell division transport system permease protein
MSSRFKFFFTEALRSLTTNVATSLAATLTMILALLVVGAILIMLGSVQSEATSVAKDASIVKVFLAETATEEQVNDLRDQLTKMGEVKTVLYVSKEDAYKRAQEIWKDNPDVLKNLTTNPFPASLEATLKDPTKAPFVGKQMEGQPGVQVKDGVNWGGKDAERVVAVVRTVSLIMLGIGIGLIVAATLLVSNTIRLSIFARRREIEVMKLVGASNSFVRLPFMIEGFLTGLFAAVITVLLLVVGGVLLEPVWEVLRISDGASKFNADYVLLGLIGMGCVLGSIGSGITIRRYLRV